MRPTDVKFTKMSAGGNDFVVIDNVSMSGSEPAEVDAEFVRQVCARALSVGADGVIVIEPAEQGSRSHVRMIYYNSDGGRAALCGNGVRCVARLAALRRLAPADGMLIDTDAGTLEAAVVGDHPWFRFPLGSPDIRPMALVLEGTLDEVSKTIEATRVMVGVPHLVVEVRNAHGMSAAELLRLAPRLRRHPDLGPEGANVDFITVRDRGHLDIRCYERGVEAETLSSGSGCIAAALAARHLGRVDSPVACLTRVGITATVTIEEAVADAAAGTSAILSGDARIIYNGALNAEALSGFTV